MPRPAPGIFPTQGLNPRLLHLLHCQVNSLPAESSGEALLPIILDKEGLQRSSFASHF